MHNRPALHRNSRALLQRVLDEPGLDRWVRELSGPDYKALIEHVGLDDSSELLALSTPEQLIELIDETLFNGSTSETFDLERFAALLEVLHESGPEKLADRIATLPEEFLIMALSRLMSVWPTEFLRQLAELDEDGVLDKRLESYAFEEFDDYTVLSPSGLGWDALVALLTTLGESDPELFDRLLGRLCAANVGSLGEPDELVNVLDEMAEFEEDAQGEREERRARYGYVSASDAQAFLRLPPAQAPGATDAISAAYFRRLVPEPKSRLRSVSDNRLLQILRNRGLGDDAQTRKLTTGSGLLKAALGDLAEKSPERHARVLEELAFLTNVVLATVDRQSDSAPNAADAVRSVVVAVETAGVSEAGLEASLARTRLLGALDSWGPIALFRNRPR